MTVLKKNETCSLKKTKFIKRDISSENNDTFKFVLGKNGGKRDKILPNNSPEKRYETLQFIFTDFYDTAFPKREIEIKIQHLQSPWIIRDLQKSSKRKQRLYEKFLEQRATGNKIRYKKYKYLFEKIKKKSKTSFY